MTVIPALPGFSVLTLIDGNVAWKIDDVITVPITPLRAELNETAAILCPDGQVMTRRSGRYDSEHAWFAAEVEKAERKRADAKLHGERLAIERLMKKKAA
jgi:hypothetical protein